MPPDREQSRSCLSIKVIRSRSRSQTPNNLIFSMFPSHNLEPFNLLTYRPSLSMKVTGSRSRSHASANMKFSVFPSHKLTLEPFDLLTSFFVCKLISMIDIQLMFEYQGHVLKISHIVRRKLFQIGWFPLDPVAFLVLPTSKPLKVSI